MRIKRRPSRVVKIGKLRIGGSHPVAIQSMAKVKTAQAAEAICQIRALEKCGCEIIRVAVKDEEDARAIKEIRKSIRIPLVADIHFNWRLALEAIEAGADKVRLNPGNIFKKEQVRDVAAAAKLHRIPIRVGLNSGSLRGTSSRGQAGRMARAALDYIKILEGMKFYDIVISLKASNILETVDAYRRMGRSCDYPLHLGVTATGSSYAGAIKSSVALGALLLEGIGDTLRISLTDQPEQEVKAARYILEAAGLRHFGTQIISCPTCGRCQAPLIKIVNELEKQLSTMDYGLWTRPLKVAVMGCVVNGPGEAKEADIGIAFGKNEGLLFKNGKAVKKVDISNCLDDLLKEIKKAYG